MHLKSKKAWKDFKVCLHQIKSKFADSTWWWITSPLLTLTIKNQRKLGSKLAFFSVHESCIDLSIQCIAVARWATTEWLIIFWDSDKNSILLQEIKSSPRCSDSCLLKLINISDVKSKLNIFRYLHKVFLLTNLTQWHHESQTWQQSHRRTVISTGLFLRERLDIFNERVTHTSTFIPRIGVGVTCLKEGNIIHINARSCNWTNLQGCRCFPAVYSWLH